VSSTPPRPGTFCARQIGLGLFVFVIAERCGGGDDGGEATVGTVVVRDEWDVDVAGCARAHLRRPLRRRQRPPRRARRRGARTSCASRTRPRTPRRRDARRRGSRSRLAGRRDDHSRSGRARARATSRRSWTRAPPRSRGRPFRSLEIWPARRGRSLGSERRRRAPRSARQPTASDRLPNILWYLCLYYSASITSILLPANAGVG
jgi:hypothetical protein